MLHRVTSTAMLSSMSILVLLLYSASSVIGGEDHLRIAFLRETANETLIHLYHSWNSTTETLTSANLSKKFPSKLASNEPTGLLCWNAFTSEEGVFIQCYTQDGLNRPVFNYFLPIITDAIPDDPLVLYDPKLRVILTRDLQIDQHGNNIYWSNPHNFDVWVTSVQTQQSKLIVRLKSKGKSGLAFIIDDSNGYVFTGHILGSFVAWTRISDTVTVDLNLCTVAKATPTSLSAFAVDPLRQKLYVSGVFGLYWSTYADLDVPTSVFHALPNRATKFLSVTYYNGFLFALKTVTATMEVVNINATSASEQTTTYQLDPAARFSPSYSIYEDYRSGAPSNPCEKLTCTHLCLPTINGYKCACPSGLTLVQGNRCEASVILYTTANTLSASHSSSSPHVSCKIPKQRAQQRDGTPETPCPPQQVNSSLDTFSDLAASFPSDSQQFFSIPDPYSVGLLKLGNRDNCIHVYTFSSKASSTLFCTAQRILFFNMDFLQSLLFWVEEPSATSVEHVIRGRVYPFHQETHNNPLGALISGFAIDPPHQRHYWLAHPSTLISSRYDGSEKHVSIPVLSFLPAPMLQHYQQNRLLWLRNSSSRIEIAALDLETRLITPIEDNSGSIRNFLILPVLEPNYSHACAQANCSHSCFPYSPTQYVCGCPEPLKLLHNHCQGFQLYFLAAIQEGAVPYRIRSTSVPAGEQVQTILRGNELSQGLLLTVRNKQRQVCWILRGQLSVKCSNPDIKLTNIHPETTMFIFDLSGEELFFNNGNPGNITLRSLRKDSDFPFQPFLTPAISASALDTQKKIFFWSAHNKLHYVPLYNTSQQGHLQTLADSSPISAITLNMFARVVYFVQDRNVKSISYKDLFTNSQRSSTVHVVNQSPISNLQFYEEALYWTTPDLTDSAHFILHLNLAKPKERILLDISAENETLLDFVISGPQYESDPYAPCTQLPCSHFCFPVPPLEDSRCSYDCGCPEGMRLNGKRDCEEIPTNTSLIIWVTVSAVIAIIFIAGLVVALVIRGRRNVELNNLIDEIKNGNPPAANAASNQAKKAQYLPLTCIIPPSDLFVDTGKLLGDGAFGVVYQGVHLSAIVAVKSLKPTLHVDLDQLSEFAKEIKIMDYIGDHPNIVRFFGAEIGNIKRGSIYAVLEFSRFGSLLGILRKYSPDLQTTSPIYSNEPQQPPSEIQLNDFNTIGGANGTLNTNLLLQWAEHIASGMHYLSQKGIIHGDLATRNVLVFDNNVAKISDFGLSRQLYNYANYTKKGKAPLPWRWMAIESLQAMEFSTKSDVWAYGVTIWEIFSNGHLPFPDQEWTLKFVEEVQNGLTLQKPQTASQPLYDHIMKPCWALNPEQRPNFLQILETFKSI